MTDTVLNKEHGLALMHKLATDDQFRARYAAKPAAAIAELGVPLDTIVNLKAACLAPPAVLADKNTFAEAHKALAAADARACVDFHPPNHRLDYGNK